MKRIYDQVKVKYTGILRDKLLLYCLTHSWDIDTFFHGSDADEYLACLNDAFNLIKDNSLKRLISKRLQSRAKGAPAFEFALKDSLGNVVKLNDFKGKVILLDIWANPCGACAHVKKYLEKYIWSFVKNDPDFVVISIAVNNKTKWLEAIEPDSSPEFINLYTGVNNFESDDMVKHYGIVGIPFLVLIDKEGKIYSATIATSGNPPDTYGELLHLIKNALGHHQN